MNAWTEIANVNDTAQGKMKRVEDEGKETADVGENTSNT